MGKIKMIPEYIKMILLIIIGTIFGWGLRGLWVNRIKAHLKCKDCGTIMFYIPETACPYCKSEKGYIIKTGKELEA